MTTNKGFSIIELCACLVLVGIVLGIALPTFHHLLMRTERRMMMERIHAAIALAKQEAFARNTTLTLCGSYDQRTCHPHKDWSRGFILIATPSHQSTLPIPTLIRVFAGTHYGTLVFAQFSTHLQIKPDGHNERNGTFIYCPLDANRFEAAALVINKASHLYKLEHRNIHGILLKDVGTPQEAPIHCR